MLSMKSETIGERVRRLREAKGIARKDLAADAGMSYTGLSDLESGKARSTTKLHRLAALLDIRVAYLENGKGSPDLDDHDADWPEVMGYKVHASLGDGATPDEYAETHKLKFRAESLRKKRLRPDKLGVVYGRGDSMAPTIENGDAILFDTADTTPRDGQLYVISYDGELFAKRLMELDGMWFAASDNREKHKPVRLDPERGVNIVGRVRWIAGWVD